MGFVKDKIASIKIQIESLEKDIRYLQKSCNHPGYDVMKVTGFVMYVARFCQECGIEIGKASKEEERLYDLELENRLKELGLIDDIKIR